MLMDLMGWSYNFALQPYGPRWRQHRKLFHEHFQPSVVAKYLPAQIEEARSMTLDILQTPENLGKHIRRMFGKTVMQVVYGMGESYPDRDKLIDMAEYANAGFIEAGMPGTFLVDIIPALKYVPDWFPGAGFKRKAAKWKQATDGTRTEPFKQVMDQLSQGVAGPAVQASVAADMIASLPSPDNPAYDDEKQIAEGVASVSFSAGADTTLVSVRAFFLAATMYPEVVKRAQKELDEVVGPDRLPDFGDEASLPYIWAICMEIMRWHQVLPLGIPHMSTSDDIYDGYFIPKGTIVMANAWSILHDCEVFDDPFTFKPERYLNSSNASGPQPLDPNNCGFFGYGRRICPGRYFSNNSLFAIVSTVLSVLDVSAPLDKNGQPQYPKYEVSTGLLADPVPFDCVIRPRSEVKEELLKSYVANRV